MESFRLTRLAECIHPEFRPENVICMSYDTASYRPTHDALNRFRDERVLPKPDVPGNYGMTVYEEAALHRHGRVAQLFEGNPDLAPTPDKLPELRALALIEIEAFLRAIFDSYEEACAIAISLLALPAILDPKSRAALADDALDVLIDPPVGLNAWDTWALSVGLPAVIRAADRSDEEVERARSLATERARAAAEKSLFLEFESKESVLDALAMPEFMGIELMDGSVYRTASRADFEELPIYCDDYDKMFTLIERWCPDSARQLREPFRLHWPEHGAVLRLSPVDENPLWHHSVELEWEG